LAAKEILKATPNLVAEVAVDLEQQAVVLGAKKTMLEITPNQVVVGLGHLEVVADLAAKEAMLVAISNPAVVDLDPKVMAVETMISVVASVRPVVLVVVTSVNEEVALITMVAG
jgi:hypothetical protein